MVKVKSRWWLQHKGRARCRWHRADKRPKIEAKQKKRWEMSETREQRVVLRGWDCRVCPGQLLDAFAGLRKLEALCSREDGKTGTLVLGFGSEQDARAVRGRQRVCGQEVWAEQAYSARCRSDRYRFVRTWWRQEGGEEDVGCEMVEDVDDVDATESNLDLCKCQ